MQWPSSSLIRLRLLRNFPCQTRDVGASELGRRHEDELRRNELRERREDARRINGDSHHLSRALFQVGRGGLAGEPDGLAALGDDGGGEAAAFLEFGAFEVLNLCGRAHRCLIA